MEPGEKNEKHSKEEEEDEAVGEKGCENEASEPEETERQKKKQGIAEEGTLAEVTELESLCFSCGKKGRTLLQLTDIPHFRSQLLSSFRCDHCGHTDSDVQSTADILPQGISFTLMVSTPLDLDRQLVHSGHAHFAIPSVQLEWGSGGRSAVTTVQGLLLRVREGLLQDQQERLELAPEEFEKIQKFVSEKLQPLIDFQQQGEERDSENFTLVVRDISGYSHVSGPPGSVSPADPQLLVRRFDRTPEENRRLGIFPKKELQQAEKEEEKECCSDDEDLANSVLCFDEVRCPECQNPHCPTRMTLTKIPHFKEVVVMATTCDKCGWKSTEVKAGGGVEPRGRRITLAVGAGGPDQRLLDFNRDVLVSETCNLEIPELDFSVGGGCLGGKFTTVEGLLLNVREMVERNPLACGDSADAATRASLQSFLAKLDELCQMQRNFTLALDDPAGNSYVQNVCAPDPDPALTTQEYERSFQQNEILGLNHINV